MRTLSILVVAFLLSPVAVVSTSAEPQVGASASADVPNPSVGTATSGSLLNKLSTAVQARAESTVDREQDEPGNNNCGGAIPWPDAQAGVSSGWVGGEDPADWSSIRLLSTEVLTGHSAQKAVVVEATRPDCNPGLVNVATAESDARHYLRVTSASGARVPYDLAYGIEANDALSGADVGGTPANAYTWPVIVGAEPWPHEGALATRGGSDDEDWYRFEVPIPVVSDVQTAQLPVALVTVSFTARCTYASGSLQLYGEDGLLPVTQEQTSCGGEIRQSCVAVGAATIHAKTLAKGSNIPGTSYRIEASASPLYLLSVDGEGVGPYAEYAFAQVASGNVGNAVSGSSDVVQRSGVNVKAPWCSPLAPILLSAVLGAWDTLQETPLPNDVMPDEPTRSVGKVVVQGRAYLP